MSKLSEGKSIEVESKPEILVQSVYEGEKERSIEYERAGETESNEIK